MVTRQAGKAPPPPLAQPAPPPISGAGDNGPSDLKRQLLWRMGLAGMMILALLAALAVFDAVNTPDEPVAPQFSEPVPVRKRELVQALTPAAAPAEAPAEAPAAVPVLAEPEGERCAARPIANGRRPGAAFRRHRQASAAACGRVAEGARRRRPRGRRSVAGNAASGNRLCLAIERLPGPRPRPRKCRRSWRRKGFPPRSRRACGWGRSGLVQKPRRRAAS
jgi:hypothetical protein